MPTLEITDFNIACATLGGFILLYGLVSYLSKQRFHLSEALISVLAGVVFSPHGIGFIDPLHYAQGSVENLKTITLSFSRLVLGVQLVIAGVQLPSRYLLKAWRELALLLGPGLVGMWLCSSLAMYIAIPGLPFLHALAIAACISPTDPVLSQTIVKGRFADKNVSKDLQHIIVAESGANDGLGYPFLFFAIYLIKYTGMGGAGQSGGIQEAMVLWFGETWLYVILLSVFYGVAVGWAAKKSLRWAGEKGYVDRESFLVFAIALALFIVGTCGMVGSDDVLACFVAGNVFAIESRSRISVPIPVHSANPLDGGWSNLEIKDDSVQPTVEMLLNLAIFIWIGAITPWRQFFDNELIPFGRLVALGVMILLFRRIPVILAMYRFIPQVENIRQAMFMGFFGPIGVSAVFYLYISLEFLERGILVDGKVREDAQQLADTMYIVVWFLIMCSVFVHGLSIPVVKLGGTIFTVLGTAARDKSGNIPSGSPQTSLFGPWPSSLPSGASTSSLSKRAERHILPVSRLWGGSGLVNPADDDKGSNSHLLASDSGDAGANGDGKKGYGAVCAT